ncbi:MAG: hypothetical protein QOJ63_3239, partial [Solirubrobacteraceae bacterium]|nr:hypothetical protein [Solirubrobacteraceae bacterium]
DLVRLVRSDVVLLVFTVTAMTYVIATGAATFFFAAVAADLTGGHGEGTFGFLVAAMAVGGVVGAAVAGRMRADVRKVYIVGNVLEACCWPLIQLAPVSGAAYALVFMAGFLESVATVMFYAEIQVRLAQRAVGRYFAALIPATRVSALCGLAIGSVVVPELGVATLGVIMAVLIGVPVIASAGALMGAGAPRAEGA